MRFRNKLLGAALSLPVVLALNGVAAAETLTGAMAKAYANNSGLNADRAGVRSTDENVAIAKSGYRPQIFSTAVGNYTTNSTQSFRSTTLTFGVTLQQNLFDGFQTRNNVHAAESGVMASRENLRNSSQNVLLQAVSAYMDVIRDREVAKLREQNLKFLTEQVRAAKSRFDVGEGTRTDVAQAEAGKSAAIAQLSAAKAAAASSEANYRYIIGEAPGKLSTASPASKMLPRSLEAALARTNENHPAIKATSYLVDAASYKVKSKEGAFLPQVSAEVSANRGYLKRDSMGNPFSTAAGAATGNSASVTAQVRIPIYQGGLASATVRQSKEDLGQARITVDATRDQVRSNASSAWYQYNAAQTAVSANKELVNAAQLALNGVIEERNVGQRTTLDVLNAQADVINAKLNLLAAQHDVVVASYGILSAMGDLSVGKLGLNVAEYKPEEHYEAVKDKWYGLRTPDGR